MISLDRAKKLINQGGTNRLTQEAEKYIDRIIEQEATNKGKLDFLIFEKLAPGSYYFDYGFRSLKDKFESAQVEDYRKKIVKAYRDEGYNAEYKLEKLDTGYNSFCFEIHGFIEKDKLK